MCLFASGVGAEPLPDTIAEAWNGALEQRTLGDGSVLNEYVARTEASSTDGSGMIELLVSFVPRFRCAPLMGLRFSEEHAAAVADLFADGDSVVLTLDDKAVNLPLAVDENGTSTTLWLHGSVDSQNELRARFDVASRARIVLSDTVEYGFSLLGSQRSLKATEEHCLLHEPIPYEQ